MRRTLTIPLFGSSFVLLGLCVPSTDDYLLPLASTVRRDGRALSQRSESGEPMHRTSDVNNERRVKIRIGTVRSACWIADNSTFFDPVIARVVDMPVNPKMHILRESR
ncbi:hypothetical protein BCAR13_80116 [Paraburkholderia caribensis]|nr:hypothetical protein BCAR13_80116 [Paraburkholderia caribensis]